MGTFIPPYPLFIVFTTLPQGHRVVSRMFFVDHLSHFLWEPITYRKQMVLS